MEKVFAVLGSVILCSFFLLISPVVAEDTIKIGWIGPLTGDGSALGVDSVEVVRQVVDRANKAGGIQGRKIELMVGDDQYQTAKTVSEYVKLVGSGAKLLFVVTYGGVLAIANRAETDNVLIIDALDCDEQLAALPKNTFCVAKKSEELGVKTAELALKKKQLPAAVIYAEDDPFPPKVAKASKAELEAGGGRIVLFEGVSSQTRDFRPLLLQVKASGAQSLFLYGYDYFGSAMKQARELGLTAQFYSFSNINSPGYRAAAGSFVDGTYASGWFAPRGESYERFIEDYKLATGREPLLEVATIPTYDMANVVVAGLRETGGRGAIDVAALRDYLYRVKDYQGLSGRITMDSDGAVRTLSCGIYKYQNGRYEKIE